jgi:TRAP-type C4-dicarboxylate transport system permease large subunit
MIIWSVVTATAFSNIYTAVGAPDFLNSMLEGFGVGRWPILITIQLMFFFLGMVMDPAGIVMITTPVYILIIKTLGFDPVWFGILFIINMEMGNQVEIKGADFFQIRDGRLAEIRVIFDSLGFMQQLGAIPTPSQH